VPLPGVDGEPYEPLPGDDGERGSVALLDPEVSEPLVEPFDVMSMASTCGVSPVPEKLARTWSPSLMSSIDARSPSFVTWVPGSTFSIFGLPESVRVSFERSKLWTLPLSASKWPIAVPLEGSFEAVEPDELPVPIPLEPIPMEFEPEPIDVLPVEPVESRGLLPRLPWLESWGDDDVLLP
jgi:hypothetical protein